jgi:hypothetical protein
MPVRVSMVGMLSMMDKHFKCGLCSVTAKILLLNWFLTHAYILSEDNILDREKGYDGLSLDRSKENTPLVRL